MQVGIIGCVHQHKVLQFYYLIIAVLLTHVTSQVISQVTLTDSLEPGQSACPKENVIFNCIVRGSRILLWGSDEYIGTGGKQLEFSTADQDGDRINSSVNQDTFAILTNITDNGGTILLQSELHIVSNQSSIVSCLTTDAESRQSIDFIVLGDGMCKYYYTYLKIQHKNTNHMLKLCPIFNSNGFITRAL